MIKRLHLLKYNALYLFSLKKQESNIKVFLELANVKNGKKKYNNGERGEKRNSRARGTELEKSRESRNERKAAGFRAVCFTTAGAVKKPRDDLIAHTVLYVSILSYPLCHSCLLYSVSFSARLARLPACSLSCLLAC